MTTLIFLRHAETKKDPALPASEWLLSEKGQQQAEIASQDARMETVDVIFVSEERKTSFTAKPIAEHLGKQPTALAAFNEVARGNAFLTDTEFEQEKVRQLQDLSYHAFGGESGIEALVRFKKGIEHVIAQHPNQTILIVTHGTILNIYFADLLSTNEQLPNRWQKTAFCAIGMVQDERVVQDIV